MEFDERMFPYLFESKCELSVFEAYYEKVPNLIWNQSTSVTLRVFSLVDGVPDEVANISVKSEEQYPTRSFVHVYPDQFTHGPIYIGLDHNIPRGVNDMIYVHLNVIVTPVYRCQPTTPVASHPGLLTDLNLAASEDSSVNLFKCGRMPNKTEQQQPTDVCISVDLVCDGYNNCPLEFGHADESENHCTSNFIFQHNNVLWFLVATTCPIITIAIAIMLWASHRQCRYCCRKYLQKRSSYFNTESEFEITLSGTRTYSCGQTLSQNSLIRNSETRSARAATLPPNLAPPTYQEALKTSCKKTTQPRKFGAGSVLCRYPIEPSIDTQFDILNIVQAELLDGLSVAQSFEEYYNPNTHIFSEDDTSCALKVTTLVSDELELSTTETEFRVHLLVHTNIIITIDSMTFVFNTDASLPYNHDLFERHCEEKNKGGRVLNYFILTKMSKSQFVIVHDTLQMRTRTSCSFLKPHKLRILRIVWLYTITTQLIGTLRLGMYDINQTLEVHYRVTVSHLVRPNVREKTEEANKYFTDRSDTRYFVVLGFSFDMCYQQDGLGT
ncbi:hypothetical protein CSKR_108583 [Clonorchis sinensis]|uniref:Uncharacterized protein n=1 Tax=Clonorchis sinensis TaxID=79923 RepID=A0A3R7G6Q4_CLOSI|nr:hypothetical protein CSKR_108583 [Clonorchis sinensis]